MLMFSSGLMTEMFWFVAFREFEKFISLTFSFLCSQVISNKFWRLIVAVIIEIPSVDDVCVSLEIKRRSSIQLTKLFLLLTVKAHINLYG